MWSLTLMMEAKEIPEMLVFSTPLAQLIVPEKISSNSFTYYCKPMAEKFFLVVISRYICVWGLPVCIFVLNRFNYFIVFSKRIKFKNYKNPLLS
jgi:hypothetical protein